MFVLSFVFFFFFFQAEDGIRDRDVTGVQTCALPICHLAPPRRDGPTPERRHRPRAGRSPGRRPRLRARRAGGGRSEERRVGKEWRSGGAACRGKKEVGGRKEK